MFLSDKTDSSDGESADAFIPGKGRLFTVTGVDKQSYSEYFLIHQCKHVFWLRNKKKIFSFWTLIWRPGVYVQ